MVSKHLVFWLLAACASTSALAQWKWIDKDGRVVFSDRPPPADIPAKSIQKRMPATAATGKMAADSEDSDDSLAQGAPSDVQSGDKSRASNPRGSKPGAPSELATMREKATEAAAKQREVEAAANRQVRMENCKLAKQSLAVLDSGVRVRQANAVGAREYLDDAQRDAERRKANEMVAQNCS